MAVTMGAAERLSREHRRHLMAFDPSNSNTIYAGTGEGFFNADGVRGAGIFKSTDAGR